MIDGHDLAGPKSERYEFAQNWLEMRLLSTRQTFKDGQTSKETAANEEKENIAHLESSSPSSPSQ